MKWRSARPPVFGFCIFVCLIACAAGWPGCALASAGSWQISTIDSGGDVGQDSSIAVDSDNHVHISYYDATNKVKYATNASGAWVIETVDNSGSGGAYTAIAVGPDNKIHISYYGANGILAYATKGTGVWTIEPVDTYENGTGKYTSIVVDANGKVHIAYYEYFNMDLKYATNATGSWVLTTIDSNGRVGEYASIALDSGNKVHIAYRHYSGYLRYATTNEAGASSTQTVDNEVDCGWWPSIAVDAGGKVHISHWMGGGSGSSYDLKYTTNATATGDWVTEAVDIPDDVGKYSSLALDSRGRAHISYFDDTNDNLKYATNATGAWVTDTVDIPGDVGKYTSLAVDHHDGVHISYYDATNLDLKVAVRPPYAVTVARDGTGTGTVTSDPSGMDCGSTCLAWYPSGMTVAFAASAQSGSTFAGWSGACTGTAPCQVAVDQAKSLTATYDLIPPPTANAGTNQIVFDSVTLDGSGSTSQGNIVSWSWALNHQTQPAYNRNAEGEHPLLTNLATGFYDVVLTVTDNRGVTDTSTMVLAVVPAAVVQDIRTGWYSQAQLDQAVATERLKWDIDNDGKLGLPEAIYILQTLAGAR